MYLLSHLLTSRNLGRWCSDWYRSRCWLHLNANAWNIVRPLVAENDKSLFSKTYDKGLSWQLRVAKNFSCQMAAEFDVGSHVLRNDVVRDI
jgi:hypothetical protein